MLSAAAASSPSESLSMALWAGYSFTSAEPARRDCAQEGKDATTFDLIGRKCFRGAGERVTESRKRHRTPPRTHHPRWHAFSSVPAHPL